MLEKVKWEDVLWETMLARLSLCGQGIVVIARQTGSVIPNRKRTTRPAFGESLCRHLAVHIDPFLELRAVLLMNETLESAWAVLRCNSTHRPPPSSLY